MTLTSVDALFNNFLGPVKVFGHLCTSYLTFLVPMKLESCKESVTD